MEKRRGFGAIRKLPSGRYQASYTGPDAARHKAPTTFETKIDAEGWLHQQRTQVAAEDWTAPAIKQRRAARLTFTDYATTWLEARDLKPTSRQLYASLLQNTHHAEVR